jgi:serine phosphatase RsbU (regulator of sigma subunit)
LRAAGALTTADPLGLLHRVTARLASSLDRDALASYVLGEVILELGGRSGAFCLVDDEEIAIAAASANYSDEVLAAWGRFPLSAELPASVAARSGAGIFLESPADRDARYPMLSAAPLHADAAYAIVPLVADGLQPLGVLVVGFAEPRVFLDDEREALATLGTHCALALERARLHEAEEQAVARLSLLARVSEVLASTLDLDETLEAIVRVLPGLLGDFATIVLPDPKGALRITAAWHRDEERQALLDELRGRVLPPRSATASAFSLGRTVVIPEVDETEACRTPEGAERFRAAFELGIGSAIAVPLIARGRAIGVLGVGVTAGSTPFSAAQLELAADVATRAAVALDNATLFTQRTAIAAGLQRGLLPPELPDIHGLELAARYHPVGRGLLVGGDFYDVFPLDDSGRWALVIGDVVGNGVDAAALTAVVRHTARAASRFVTDPVDIFAAVNDALRRETLGERFCTLVLASVEVSAGVAAVELFNGGHPVPVIVHGDGRVASRNGGSGRLLGVFETAPPARSSVRLDTGDALVLFTDGLLEARGPDRELFGDERVHAALRAVAGADARTIADAVCDEVVRFSDGELTDDVAVLVAKVAVA